MTDGRTRLSRGRIAGAGPAAIASALLAAAALGVAPAHAAASACRMQLIGELKTESGGGSPRLKGSIEGHPVSIVADTGSFATLLLESSARRLGIPLDDARGVDSYGAGGVTRMYVTPVLNLTIGGFSKRISLPVISGDIGVDMLLGDDFFNQADVEIDLGHNVIRMLRTDGCGDDEMPYWTKGSYSLAKLVPTDGIGQYVTEVKINGRPVRAAIDSGATATVVSPEAAQRVGMKLGAAAGHANGVGERTMSVREASATELVVGDEVIRNPVLRVADLFGGVSFNLGGSHLSSAPDDVLDMLLGDDFLRTHRILLSHARGKAYFTYEGGAIFSAPPSGGSAPKPPQPSSPPSGSPRAP